jgi:hypothetical protein
MSRRFRHCIECPKCHTRYVLGFSPHSNGSYLAASQQGFAEEWVLYCSCATPPVPSRWRYDELKFYAVSNPAFRRGYGSLSEIVTVGANHRITNTTRGDSVKAGAFSRRMRAGEKGK